MASILLRLRFFPVVAAILLWAGASAFAQTITCSPAGTAPKVRAEGLTEAIGTISLVCIGGTASTAANLTLFITLNTNITNRTDAGNNPTGITVSANTGAATVASGTESLYSATTLQVMNVVYTVPTPAATTPVTITISGIRAAAALVPASASLPVITASVAGVGAQFPGSNSTTVAVIGPSLLASVNNNGIPCSGSPAPAAYDFNSFVAAGAVPSTIRLTEASPAAFTVKDGTTDTGSRIVINLSGYSLNDRVFVPDAIVGSDGTNPTSAGAFGGSVNSGNYTPGVNQLLLIRIGGADANGYGGYFAVPVPNAPTAVSSYSEIGLSSGAGYAVYEVASANPNLAEIAQVPIFLYAPTIGCTSNPIVVPTITASMAPISTVVTATQTDPIPRFIANTAASDCTVDGDCSAGYFPKFSVDTTPVNVSAPSLGGKVGATINISNTGAGVIPFATSVTYSLAGSGWLSVTPSSGEVTSQSGVALQLLADPSQLQPGTYTATVSVNGGSFGNSQVPVTLTVGPPGVTVSNVLNAATGTSPVAPGSYVAIYGLNMGGQTISVTFSGLNATVIYSSATQINVIVPTGLAAGVTQADVVVHVDGKTSNSFKTQLAANAPGIFNPGIENADGSVNSSINPAQNGSFVAVYLTGLTIPLTGQVTVNIGNQNNLIPLYAGAQPTLQALDQVDVTIPTALAGAANPVPLTVCIPGSAGTPVCSNAANLYIK